MDIHDVEAQNFRASFRNTVMVCLEHCILHCRFTSHLSNHLREMRLEQIYLGRSLIIDNRFTFLLSASSILHIFFIEILVLTFRIKKIVA